MIKPLVGSLLAIIGAALMLLREHFADYALIAMIAGFVLLLIGSSQVSALQDYWVRLEAASKRKADKSDDSQDAP